MSLLLLLSALGYKFVRKSRVSLISELLTIGALLCNVGSIVLCSIDLNKIPILKLVDLALTGRFSSCHQTMQLFGIKLFGQPVITELGMEREMLGISYRYKLFLDNAYCAVLLTWGLIGYLIFTCLYLYNMHIQTKDGNDELVFFLFLFALYGIMERGIYMVIYNLFLISASSTIYRLAANKQLQNT